VLKLSICDSREMTSLQQQPALGNEYSRNNCKLLSNTVSICMLADCDRTHLQNTTSCYQFPHLSLTNYGYQLPATSSGCQQLFHLGMYRHSRTSVCWKNPSGEQPPSKSPRGKSEVMIRGSRPAITSKPEGCQREPTIQQRGHHQRHVSIATDTTNTVCCQLRSISLLYCLQ
jgi:hypothetical protein